MKEYRDIVVRVEINVEHLAEQFAALSDDAQAQFFCFAAKILGDAMPNQAWYAGNHLKTCECSTFEGREFIKLIAEAME